MAGSKTFGDAQGHINFDGLRNYVRPEENATLTESLQHVQALVKKSKVIHLHGMSGSGKSKIVAGVCNKLCDEARNQIIWQVRCRPDAKTIKSECRDFIRQLGEQSGLGLSQQDYEAAGKALESGRQSDLSTFVNVLNKLDLPPVILVFEDVVFDDDKVFVKNLIDSMRGEFIEILKLKLIIIAQHRDTIYLEPDLEVLCANGFYQTYEVKGFTPMEALDFMRYDGLKITSQEKVDNLARDLAYSPLRLRMAKSFCMKYKISYEEYWDSLGTEEYVKKEKELLQKHPDIAKYHGYEVIMRLFQPVAGADEDKHKEFKVMKMLSFVSNLKVPCQLLQRFFQQLKPAESITRLDDSVKYLLTRLRDDVSAEVDGDLLTVHADILRALNASMHSGEKRDILKCVVFAMASLLDKDNRIKPTYGLLHSLKQHAETVVRHSALYFDELISDEAQLEDFELLLGLSKLNEVMGFAISQHPGFRTGYEEDEYYQRAMDCIWVIVCAKIGGGKCTLSWLPTWFFPNKAKAKTDELINYEKDKDPRKTAEDIYKKIKEASVAKQSVKEALKNDWERLYPVKEMHLNDMKAKVDGGAKLDWDKMRKEIVEAGALSKSHKELLLKHEMVVPWEKLVKYYLSERLGSILHSCGRLDNYKGDIIPPDMHERCVWYSDLGFYLCDIAYEKTKVKSLFHYILQANNQLPRMVRKCKDESDEAFLETINRSLRIARAVKEEKDDYFEHGIYKRVSGTPFTMMNALKYIVKANTKVYKRPQVAKTVKISQADDDCAELCNLCLSNARIIIAATCLVHAGKYMAATGEYGNALKTFESAFESGISDRMERNATSYCWALYNMGRAITRGGEKIPDRKNYVDRFNDRYDMISKMDIPEKWKKLLDSMHEEVNGSSGV